MRKQLGTLALFTCITATTAFGSTIVSTETDSQAKLPEVRQGQHQHKGHRVPGRHLEMMAKELGLTDQQKTEAKVLFEKNRAQHKPLFGALRTSRQQLRALVRSGTADEAAIRAQAAQVAAAEAELAVKKAQGAKQFLALLTPEQATKLQAIQAKREHKPGKSRSCQEAVTK